MNTTANQVTSAKSTIYFRNDFGNVKRLEVVAIKAWRGPCAQYPSAVHLEYRAPRARGDRHEVFPSSPYVLILEGWGHPKPETPFTRDADTTVTCFAFGQIDGFEAMISAHVSRTGARIVADYRGVDTHESL